MTPDNPLRPDQEQRMDRIVAFVRIGVAQMFCVIECTKTIALACVEQPWGTAYPSGNLRRPKARFFIKNKWKHKVTSVRPRRRHRFRQHPI